MLQMRMSWLTVSPPEAPTSIKSEVGALVFFIVSSYTLTSHLPIFSLLLSNMHFSTATILAVLATTPAVFGQLDAKMKSKGQAYGCALLMNRTDS
jgi:hypothetical protein